MRRILRILSAAGACACATPWPAQGYEPVTHAAITSHAIQNSVLTSDPTLLESLGLTQRAFEPDPTTYFDIDTATLPYSVRSRITSVDWEEPMISALSGMQHPQSPASWLVRGVIREDDNTEVHHLIHPEPDVPYSTKQRVFNHFFDPVTKRPLQIDGFNIGKIAPDWAMGTEDAFGNAQPDVGRNNNYSLPDAREAMWRALTLTDRQGTRVTPPSAAYDDGEQRLAYWKTAFRSFGGVLHLIQDMAQPQHTRNEAHSGWGPDIVEHLASGNASVYEHYMRERTLAGSQGRAVRLSGAQEVVEPLSYALISPVPSFPRYSDYWSTNTPETGGNTGRGLADYSNHGFLTAAKNIGNLDYYSPPPNSNSSFYSQVTVSRQVGGVQFLDYYLAGDVTDVYAGTVDADVPLARDSILSGDDVSLFDPRYTVDRHNYDQMAALLVPRAVAYSAGLLNHFFRGRISAALTNDGVFSIANATATGFTTVRATLTNVTPNSLALHNGQAIAVATYHVNNCFQDDLSGQYGLPGKSVVACRSGGEHIVTSTQVPIASLATGASVDLTFDFSADPIPFSATDLQLQIVYRGGLDQEADAVIAATLDIGEPTPFDLVNMTDYFQYGNQFYPIPTVYDSTTVPSQIDATLFDEYIDANDNGTYESSIDRNLARRPLSYGFSFGGRALGTVTVPSSSYARMMLLLPREGATMQLNKVSFGYTVPVPIQAVVSSQTRQDVPGLFRGKYVYQTSPDFMFYPQLAPVPEELTPLEAGPEILLLDFDPS